jgi:hypothetical protein
MSFVLAIHSRVASRNRASDYVRHSVRHLTRISPRHTRPPSPQPVSLLPRSLVSIFPSPPSKIPPVFRVAGPLYRVAIARIFAYAAMGDRGDPH